MNIYLKNTKMKTLFTLTFLFYCFNTVLSQDEISEIYIPNTFTADNNGLNDTWKTHSETLWDEFLLEVFNPWGKLVWVTNDPEEYWMGESDSIDPNYYSPNGMYHYVLKARKGNQTCDKKGYVFKLR